MPALMKGMHNSMLIFCVNWMSWSVTPSYMFLYFLEWFGHIAMATFCMMYFQQNAETKKIAH